MITALVSDRVDRRAHSLSRSSHHQLPKLARSGCRYDNERTHRRCDAANDRHPDGPDGRNQGPCTKPRTDSRHNTGRHSEHRDSQGAHTDRGARNSTCLRTSIVWHRAPVPFRRSKLHGFIILSRTEQVGQSSIACAVPNADTVYLQLIQRQPRQSCLCPAPQSGAGHRSSTYHPRKRGEHLYPYRRYSGSSPPTRGALTTNAGLPPIEDHPRPRGEHTIASIAAPRRPDHPAYAGSTSSTPWAGFRWTDHPRVRGEHMIFGERKSICRGSSPYTRGTRPGQVRGQRPLGLIPARTRGTQLVVPQAGHDRRLIPARAGNTLPVGGSAQCRAAHPRTRGEHTS